jgi:hypothetical protein
MAKLLQVILLAGTILLLLPAETAAQDYCSLIVKLVDANNRQDLSIKTITLTESGGRTLKAENRGGEVRFCDLGILPVTITVGSPYCHEVNIRNVPLQFGETRTIKILSDNALCSNGSRESVPLPGCRILLRFRDEQSNWISGVTLRPLIAGTDFHEVDIAQRSNPFRLSDASGRTLVQIALKKELHATADRDGYKPEEINLNCTSETYISERTVTLHRLN